MSDSLKSLERRLEEATGPLDDDTVADLLHLPWRNEVGPWRYFIAMGDAGESEMHIDGPDWPSSKAYSELYEWPDRSLDAAVALVERLLPGITFGIRGPWQYAAHHAKAGQAIWECELVTSDCGTPPFDGADHASDARAPTPALALCLALVRALLAREGK